ncbi:MAG TPA: methyltransferase domain-containing protein, partial [Propionibacteriaceae bacterium]
RYLEQGRPYLERTGHGAARIQMCSNHYPFPDQQFDIVLSDQVIEHVADLDKLFREVARVSRVGALGLHIFPARWRPVESHLLTPLVHWLPKGRTRRLVLRSLLAIGLAAPYFKDRSLKDRVEIFGAYSDSETFYRSLGELRRVCVQHGLQPDMSKIVAAKISRRLPGVPQALLPMASLLYRHAFSVILQTVRCEGTH